jgi:ankyrin repeat protein
MGLDPNRRNWLGITLLHWCAAKRDTGVADVWLESGADIKVVETEWSSTPLGWAAREGQTEMVSWLLAHGANPDLPQDGRWARPLEWVTRWLRCCSNPDRKSLLTSAAGCSTNEICNF